MCTPDISIIMPLYNGASWVERALESVLLQQGVTWELLVVNDSSTDNSPELVQKYVEKDARISLISNVHTKGLSGTRNTAIEQARGKYFMYLDCDDLLWEGSLQALFTLAEKTQAPLIRGCLSSVNALNYYVSSGKLSQEEERQKSVSYRYIPQQNITHMYHLGFVKQHNLRYDEDLHCSEDTLFLYKAYTLVDSIPILTTPNYIYFVDHKTINYTPEYIMSLCTGLERLLIFLDTHNDVDRALPYAQYFLTKWIQQIYIMQNESKEMFADFLQKGLFCITYPKWDIMPQITTFLGEDSEKFYTLCLQKNISELLELLNQKQLIAPPPVYTVYPRAFSRIQKIFSLYPVRLRNLLTVPESRTFLWYLLKLHWVKFWRR